MTQGSMTKDRRLLLTLAGFALLAPAGQAMSAEFCVSCTGPEATYNCVADDIPAGGTDAGIKLSCISELAKAGHHASCAIARTAVAPCNGERKVLSGIGGLDGFPSAHEPASGLPPASVATTPSEPPAPDPAETTIAKSKEPAAAHDRHEEGSQSAAGSFKKAGEKASDAAEKAAQSAAGALQQAGTAISSAAKKSWRCLSSMFDDC
jgi:hypothetical protein